MQHSSLLSFLSGQTLPQAFWQEIECETDACAVAVATGGTGHVVITDGPPANVRGEHIDLLLEALENGTLPLRSAAYIADALIFSDDFYWSDDSVSEVLFAISDESNPVTLVEVVTLRQQLCGNVR